MIFLSNKKCLMSKLAIVSIEHSCYKPVGRCLIDLHFETVYFNVFFSEQKKSHDFFLI